MVKIAQHQTFSPKTRLAICSSFGRAVQLFTKPGLVQPESPVEQITRSVDSQQDYDPNKPTESATLVTHAFPQSKKLKSLKNRQIR